jgi:hypothetical protein
MVPEVSLREAVTEAAAAQPPPSPEVPTPLPGSARLGVAALALGLLAVLVLCLPFLGYVSPILSGLGLLLGLAGLLAAQVKGTGSYPLAGGAALAPRFGGRARDYPLAGVGVCLLALALALLPFLRH